MGVRWTCPSCKDDTTWEVAPGVSQCLCGREFYNSSGSYDTSYSNVRMTCPSCRDDTTMHVRSNIYQCICGAQFTV